MMTHNGNRIAWLFIVLLFHAAVSTTAHSSAKMTIIQTISGLLLESVAPMPSWGFNNGRILEGEFVTKLGAFKHVVMVNIAGNYCSGAVISPNFVISSTQCYTTSIGVGWVFAGGIKYQRGDLHDDFVQKLSVDKLLIYTETSTERDLAEHDVMLVVVIQPGFRWDQFVQPIRFTDQRRFHLRKAVTCSVVGFGGDNVQKMTVSQLLDQCPKDGGGGNVVCANKYRPCTGDAGAPLVYRYMLVGVLRKEGLEPKENCKGTLQHQVQRFTFVGHYRDWIDKNTEVSYGVWPSGSQGYYTVTMTGARGALYGAVLMLHIWKYSCLK